jgi:hypothetical protein
MGGYGILLVLTLLVCLFAPIRSDTSPIMELTTQNFTQAMSALAPDTWVALEFMAHW